MSNNNNVLHNITRSITSSHKTLKSVWTVCVSLCYIQLVDMHLTTYAFDNIFASGIIEHGLESFIA